MRYVKKDLNDIPPILMSKKALEDLEKIAKGSIDLISPEIYKGEYKDKEGKLQSTVREKLNIYYKNKCAYCEMHCKAEIEHYRPKKGVTGDNTHTGYYWLCYSWTNLVPSCRYCNTEGGKGNQFPIIEKTKRVKEPELIDSKLNKERCKAYSSPLIDEVPYLLHPEIDTNPEQFLAFKINDEKTGIELIGIDKYERGKNTIKICNLNRPYLSLNRIESVHYHIKQRINLIFDLISKELIDISKIEESFFKIFESLEKEADNIELTHTLLRKFVIGTVDNFTNYFVPYLENKKQQEIITVVFTNYRKAYPI